MRRIILRKTGL